MSRAMCDGCRFYERERTTVGEPEYQHICWREPRPVVRKSWSKAKAVRGCAYRDTRR